MRGDSVLLGVYQGHILPEKFGVGKRKLHFSTLIKSGQMSSDTAVAALEHSPYPSEQDLDADRQYFLKKLGWSPSNLATYLARPEVPHYRYPSEKWLWEWMLAGALHGKDHVRSVRRTSARLWPDR